MAGGKSYAVDARMTRKPLWALAREMTEEALGTMAWMMRHAENEGVRLQAADKVLERAWGKAPIMIAGDEDRPIRVDIRTFDTNQVAALESALVQALGESIQQAALPHLNDAPLKSTPPKGLSQPGHLVPADMQTGLCVVPSANESCANTHRAPNSAIVASESQLDARLTRGGEGGA